MHRFIKRGGILIPPSSFLQNKIKEKGIRWRFLSTITIFIAVIAVVGYLGFQGDKKFSASKSEYRTSE